MKWKNKGHEFDEIGAVLARAKSIYLYGIGGVAQEILNILLEAKEYFHWRIYLVDRNEKLRKKGYAGMPILAPEEFFADRNQESIAVSCPTGSTGEEIYELILSHDGWMETNVFRGEDFLYAYLSVYFLYAHDMVFFTSENIVPSSLCNLNCRDCLNFTPYIKRPVIHSLEEVNHDADVFFHAVDLIYRFQITGGDPLLYPHLQEFLAYLDTNYRSQILRLEMVTNGTIIPSDELCAFLAEKQIYVFLDDYKNALDDRLSKLHDVVEEKFKRFHVPYFDNYVERWFRLYPASSPLGDADENTLVDYFTACDNPWSTIERGRISACNYALYAAKAGIVTDAASEYYCLEGFSSEDKRSLVEFRLRYNEKGYTEMCKKCGGFSKINKNWDAPAIQAKRGNSDAMEQ